MSGYDYGNARLRAMKSRLLSAEVLKSLAGAASLSALAGELSRTDYRHHIEAAVVRGGGLAQIAAGLRCNLVDRLNKVRSVYDGRERVLVSSLLLRYDIHNVKTILRGLAHHAPAQAVTDALLPVADLSEPILAEMRQLSDPRAAIDLLASIRSPLAQPLLDLRARQAGAAVQDMEWALDRWYFQQMRRIVGRTPDARLVSQSVDFEADSVNLLTVLRLVHASQTTRQPAAESLQSLLVEPGHLSRRQLLLAAEQAAVEDAVSALEDTLYGPTLAAGLSLFRRSRRLSEFEAALRRWHLRRQASLIVRDPLGVGVPLGYIALKINEIRNLRWIAQGIGLGLPPDMIQADMELG